MTATTLRELLIPGFVAQTLLFGTPISSVEEITSSTLKSAILHHFTAGSIFGVRYWSAVKYQTSGWRLNVIQIPPAEIDGLELVDGVSKKANILLQANGERQVRRAEAIFKNMKKIKPLTEYSEDDFLLADLQLRKRKTRNF